MGQGRGAPDGALRRLHIAVDLARTPLGDAGLHQIEAALDAGQNIVEVVREAAGELADGLHLLRLPQRRLGGGQGFARFLFDRDIAPAGVDEIPVERRDP